MAEVRRYRDEQNIWIINPPKRAFKNYFTLKSTLYISIEEKGEQTSFSAQSYLLDSPTSFSFWMLLLGSCLLRCCYQSDYYRVWQVDCGDYSCALDFVFHVCSYRLSIRLQNLMLINYSCVWGSTRKMTIEKWVSKSRAMSSFFFARHL